MNYHAAVRGYRQLPDQVGVTVEGPHTLSHHASPRHADYMPRIHIQPTNQGSIFRAPEVSFRPSHPPKKNNNTHATQSKAKHSKKRTVEHLCSSTYRDWVSWLVLNSNHAYASVCRGTHAQCDTYHCDTYHTGLHSASLRRTGESESSFSSEAEGGSTGSSSSLESEAGSKGSGGGAGRRDAR